MNKLCCFSPLCVPVAFRQTSYTNGASPASNSNQTTGNQNGSTQEVWKLLLSLFFPGVFPRPFVGYRKFNPSCDLLISFPINSLDANEKPRWLTCVFCFTMDIFFSHVCVRTWENKVCAIFTLSSLCFQKSALCKVKDQLNEVICFKVIRLWMIIVALILLIVLIVLLSLLVCASTVRCNILLHVKLGCTCYVLKHTVYLWATSRKNS